MIKVARKKSTDPIQEQLRQHKEEWNKSVSALINDIIHFKKSMNGHASKFHSSKSSILNPIPVNSEAISSLASEFNAIAQTAQAIMQEQVEYSTKRKKSQHVTASVDYDLISEAGISDMFHKTLSMFKRTPNINNSRNYTLSLIEICKSLKEEIKILQPMIVGSFGSFGSSKENNDKTFLLIKKIENLIKTLLNTLISYQKQVPGVDPKAYYPITLEEREEEEDYKQREAERKSKKDLAESIRLQKENEKTDERLRKENEKTDERFRKEKEKYHADEEKKALKSLKDSAKYRTDEEKKALKNPKNINEMVSTHDHAIADYVINDYKKYFVGQYPLDHTDMKQAISDYKKSKDTLSANNIVTQYKLLLQSTNTSVNRTAKSFKELAESMEKTSQALLNKWLGQIQHNTPIIRGKTSALRLNISHLCDELINLLNEIISELKSNGINFDNLLNKFYSLQDKMHGIQKDVNTISMSIGLDITDSDMKNFNRRRNNRYIRDLSDSF